MVPIREIDVYILTVRHERTNLHEHYLFMARSEYEAEILYMRMHHSQHSDINYNECEISAKQFCIDGRAVKKIYGIKIPENTEGIQNHCRFPIVYKLLHDKN